MNIVNENAIPLLERCTSRQQQLFVEKYIFSNAKIPSNRAIDQQLNSIASQDCAFREVNRSCFKQLYLEKFSLKFPSYMREQLFHCLYNAIGFKIIQFKDLFLILNSIDNDSNEWNETKLMETQTIWKVLIQVSKLCSTRESWLNNPK